MPAESSYLANVAKDIGFERKCHECKMVGVWNCLQCKESKSVIVRRPVVRRPDDMFAELGIPEL